MNAIFGLIVRLLLVAAGLVFAASVFVVAVALAGAWLLRAGWARLTGQRAPAFNVKFTAHRGGESRTPRADSVQPFGRRVPDIVDVEPK